MKQNEKPVAIDATTAERRLGSNYVEPFKSRMGERLKLILGDAFGLTQFGVNLVELSPGAQSALRHHHTLEDELVYVLEGELELVTDGGSEIVRAGSCVGFKAGDTNAHHLVNRTDRKARYLEVGSRHEEDIGVYPDDDLAWTKIDGTWQQTHKDGSRY